MKVVIDARWIFKELSGIGMYTREFLAELARRETDDRFVVLFNDADVMQRTIEACGLRGAAHLQTEMLPYGVFSPRGQLVLPKYLARSGADVFHTMNYMMPLRAFPRRQPHKIACVTTIHDVIPLAYPAAAPRSRKTQVFPLYKRLMIEIGARADAIITDSKASCDDIVRHMRVQDPAKIRVIYCGVSARFSARDTAPRDPARLRRLLYVGRADPYKNLSLLVRAFSRARESLPFDAELVVAGSPDPRYPEPQAVADALGIGNCVRWTGYISDEALLSLYHESDLLVHASRYEGFGLQIAEAMACGLPVVTSDAASLPEVAGDAAILLSPDDEMGFSRSMIEVLTQDALAADLRRRGYAQAARFTWQATVDQTLKVYAAVSHGRSGV